MIAWTGGRTSRPATRCWRANIPDMIVRRSINTAIDLAVAARLPGSASRGSARSSRAEEGQEISPVMHLEAQMLIARLRTTATELPAPVALITCRRDPPGGRTGRRARGRQLERDAAEITIGRAPGRPRPARLAHLGDARVVVRGAPTPGAALPRPQEHQRIARAPRHRAPVGGRELPARARAQPGDRLRSATPSTRWCLKVTYMRRDGLAPG